MVSLNYEGGRVVMEAKQQGIIESNQLILIVFANGGHNILWFRHHKNDLSALCRDNILLELTLEYTSQKELREAWQRLVTMAWAKSEQEGWLDKSLIRLLSEAKLSD